MAWIYTIARNSRIDRQRRDWRRDHPQIDWSERPLLPTPEEIFGVNVDIRRVHAALNDLPPDQANVLRRSFLNAETHPEIARNLGLPLGAVKSRIRLAVAHLRLKRADDAD